MCFISQIIRNNSSIDRLRTSLDGVFDPFRQRSMLFDKFAVDSVGHNTTFLPVLLIHFAVKLGEAPFARGHNILATRELELGTTECLKSVGLVLKQ